MNRNSQREFHRVRDGRTAGVLCMTMMVALLQGMPPAAAAAAHTGAQRQYSPVTAHEYPRRVYWGDVHLHTNYSADAYSYGTQSLSPADAYRFARGEEVTSETGWHAQLKRPLDFLAVTDHAEYMGGFLYAGKGDAQLLRTKLGQRWHAMLQKGEALDLIKDLVHVLVKGKDSTRLPNSFRRRVWSDEIKAAEEYNEPGRFTALIGYEWSSQIDGDNLHRVVLFRDGGDKAGQVLPFSAQDSRDPEDLWRAMAAYEARTGGKVLAIPHNANLSNGMMFADTTVSGDPLSADYARRRRHWEPLLEVTQVKGDSETHPVLSPTDEFADFERWDKANIMMTHKNEPWMLKYEYARSALQLGLLHQEQLGVNPFKFGMIGSTDIHTGLSTTAEDNFFGKFKGSEPSPRRMFTTMAPNIAIATPNWRLGASGRAAVWATQNTRAAIFDAMERRETYATTGSRIVVRFFGGWDYAPDTVNRADFAKIGYEKGVPMGGTLSGPPAGKAPVFMVTAARDPDSANLDRIQIVKGWIDAGGKRREKIYDVALSDGRRVDPATGKAPPVGNTVDVTKATYTNAIGDPYLSAVWTDPHFDPKLPAVYYARVIEIPKPRWTDYDRVFFKVTPPPGVPMTVTDRAYTSPIWYEPPGCCSAAR